MKLDEVNMIVDYLKEMQEGYIEGEGYERHPLPEWYALDKAIKALKQESKTGHWIMTNDYFTGAYESIDYVKCSCCHAYSLEEGDYCPNCGAKMAESENKE